MAEPISPINKDKKSSTISEIKKEIKSTPSSIKLDYLTTGCTLLDLVIGGGQGTGIPCGNIINIVGDKSAGKSFLAGEIVAANHHKYKNFRYNYDDGESGFTFDTEKLYNIKILNDSLQSKTVEEFDVNVKRFLKKRIKNDDIGLYVMDSLDGLSDEEKEERAEERYRQAEKGKDIKDPGTYGTKSPKFLSQEFFRTKAGELKEKKVVLCIVSQVRENLNAGLFGKKYIRSGGKALDHYAHTCLWLANVAKIKKKDKIIGVIILAKTEKSKTPRPYRSCKFIIYFDYGVDDIGTNLNYLFDCWGEDGKLKKSAENISWNKEANLSNLKEFLDNEKLLEKCRENKKQETGKSNLSVEYIVDWIKSQDDKLKTKYDKEFGKAYTYEELIEEIEQNPGMKKELQERVIQKWEQEEDEVAVKRRRKY